MTDAVDFHSLRTAKFYSSFIFTVAEYTGHTSLTYFVKACVSPCGSYLLSGSSDFAAYIWLTDQPGKPIAKLSGHNAEVTAVDWCPVEDKVSYLLLLCAFFISSMLTDKK